VSEQIGLLVGFILTLMVFSYLLGDNILYRLALYVFVGLSAGYLTLVTVDTVLLPWLNQTVLASPARHPLPAPSG
jgi:preprotein translocase subunit SecF